MFTEFQRDDEDNLEMSDPCRVSNVTWLARPCPRFILLMSLQHYPWQWLGITNQHCMWCSPNLAVRICHCLFCCSCPVLRLEQQLQAKDEVVVDKESWVGDLFCGYETTEFTDVCGSKPRSWETRKSVTDGDPIGLRRFSWGDVFCGLPIYYTDFDQLRGLLNQPAVMSTLSTVLKYFGCALAKDEQIENLKQLVTAALPGERRVSRYNPHYQAQRLHMILPHNSCSHVMDGPGH